MFNTGKSPNHWCCRYPRIQRLNPHVPIILSCSKADKLAERDVEAVKEVRVWVRRVTVFHSQDITTLNGVSDLTPLSVSDVL